MFAADLTNMTSTLRCFRANQSDQSDSATAIRSHHCCAISTAAFRRQPSDPHHLRFSQPRALGLKVSDEFTVPLCRGHHRQLHQAGNEVAWWEGLKINALPTAKGLWEQTRPKSAVVDTHQPNEIADSTATET
jgi:hypothetical protein